MTPRNQQSASQTPIAVTLPMKVIEKTTRKQIYMTKSAWDRLDRMCQQMGATRSKVIEFLLDFYISGSQDINSILVNYDAQNAKRSDRVQRGIYFRKEANHFLSHIVRREHNASMSHFLEQLILDDTLLTWMGFNLDGTVPDPEKGEEYTVRENLVGGTENKATS